MKLKIDWETLGKALWAVITQSTQAADAPGDDVNAPAQSNPVTAELENGK